MSTGTATITEEQARIVSYVEQKYWEAFLIPSDEVLSAGLRLPVTKIRKALNTPIVKKALYARGIEIEALATPDVLTPQQLMLANMLLNTHDATSTRQKLQVLGISSSTYHGWLSQPTFAKYLRTRAEQLFGAHDFEAYKALVEKVTDGDTSAIKFFFELRGIYNPKLEVNLNIEQVIFQVVEVIQRHVEPEVLLKIVEEIERVTSGQLMLKTVAPVVQAQLNPAPSVNDELFYEETTDGHSNGTTGFDAFRI